jgi:hypothetical protein
VSMGRWGWASCRTDGLHLKIWGLSTFSRGCDQENGHLNRVNRLKGLLYEECAFQAIK